MTESFYLGPGNIRFAPSSFQDVVAAAESGLLNEGHWVELKKAVPPKSPGANLELAKDLASLSVDGGIMVIGIEDKKGAAGAVTGTPIDGLASRIDATALAKVHPPLTVVTTILPHADNLDTGVILVNVPASVSAPHMVDGTYWGRGDEGKRPLSDVEVRRLLTLEQGRSEKFEKRLYDVAKVIGGEQLQHTGPAFNFLAEPASTTYGAPITETLGQGHLLQWFSEAVPHQAKWSPSLLSLQHRVPHPDGVSAASFNLSARSAYYWDQLSVLIGDDGCWYARGGSAVSPIGSMSDPNDGIAVFRAGAAIELTHALLISIAHFANNKIPFQGQWTIGVHINQLSGIEPVEKHIGRFPGEFSAYPREQYIGKTIATTDEMTSNPAQVAMRLLRRLLRAMSVEQYYFPYSDFKDIGKNRH
ncbi:MAG: helix-turn-helix domain-containing protein [Dietzia sp.]